MAVIPISLVGGKKNRATIIVGLTFLWYRESTDRMINRQHPKPYKHIILANKVEYSTSTGLYCTNHNIKVPFLIPGLSIIKIILHSFYGDNN